MMRKFLPIQILILIAVIAFYTSIAYASSAPLGPGAEGESVISGWAVSNVQYRLQEGADAKNIVEFDLDGPAKSVTVSVSTANPVFFDCFNAGGAHWYCVIGSEVGIADFDQLNVIAN
jgi:hypothetical protein